MTFHYECRDPGNCPSGNYYEEGEWMPYAFVSEPCTCDDLIIDAPKGPCAVPLEIRTESHAQGCWITGKCYCP
ncbi:hypothetical protein J7J84_06765 [bacterium]|nr:hypothetical protein [bacterium]